MKANVYFSKNVNHIDKLFHDGRDVEYQLNDFSKETATLLYIYVLPSFLQHGFKVGMTKCNIGTKYSDAILNRVKAQVNELGLNDIYYKKYGQDREIVFWGVSTRDNNFDFKDHQIHDELLKKLPGIVEKDQEWFQNIPLEDIVEVFKNYRLTNSDKIIYSPRKEQYEAIYGNDNSVGVLDYFNRNLGGKYLLNCKMRFGKCYTTYKYAEIAKLDKILILTFVPAVEESWRNDLLHIERDYDYFTDFHLKQDDFELDNNPVKPYVVFLSLQNYLGKNRTKDDVKEKIKKLQSAVFDLLVLDEYHFGAWNDRTQETIEDLDSKYQKDLKNYPNEEIADRFGISALRTLCLSGTPFKAIDRGEFLPDNTYTYSYFDEQKNKYPHESDLSYVNEEYKHFPDMKIFGYKMESLFGELTNRLFVEDRTLNRSYFSLNRFFETYSDKNKNLDIKFLYEDEIIKWLNIITGALPTGKDFPYSNQKMVSTNKHSLWLMPTVNSCISISELLIDHDYFSRYHIINLSAPGVGAGADAFNFLMNEIEKSKNLNKLGSIAITVNKLTIGVTVKPWSSVFVLKDLSSPEQYFQSIFRVQTPLVENGKVRKEAGFVYDFNIDRASSLLLNYAESSTDEHYTKLDIAKLIVRYLPIFIDGDMTSPISEEVFYQLASFGYNDKPLSKKITDISTTTRGLDDQVIADMLNDPDCSEVIKNVFAHAKMPKTKSKTAPVDSASGFNSAAAQQGRDKGFELGNLDYKFFTNLNDASVQLEFENRIQEYIATYCPDDFDEIGKNHYSNGFIKGYESGVNVPIKKMKIGNEDGLNFVSKVKEKFGQKIIYTEETKNSISNFIHQHLNDSNNIPTEYRQMLLRRWYADSFKNAVIKTLKPVINNKDTTVEDAHNVIKHILAKVFQFLYISVYRETKFSEVFENADSNVFHAAVGITKEDFRILNKYKIFQERILDNYIHEFFVNESLGKTIDTNSIEIKSKYRNSFNWFGFGIEN
jgi:hypothetical protein